MRVTKAPTRLNGATYRHFLENELPSILQDVPRLVRNSMFFMHDGSLARLSVEVGGLLELK